MIDATVIEDNVKNIRRNQDFPCYIGDGEIAEEILRRIRDTFPKARMVKRGSGWWIAENDKARKELAKSYRRRIKGFEDEIKKIQEIIRELEEE